MAHNAIWVLVCRECRAECVHSHIPDDSESYFLPKRPEMAGFIHTCGNCGAKDTYQRKDLSYRDETMPSHFRSENCDGGRLRPLNPYRCFENFRRWEWRCVAEDAHRLEEVRTENGKPCATSLTLFKFKTLLHHLDVA